MAKSKAEWVLVGGAPGEIGYCERCGRGLSLGGGPQPIEIVTAAMKAFVTIHSKCKATTYFPKPAETPGQWATGRDTGISSLTIYHVMTGAPVGDWFDTPCDPSDFGRCYRLLKLFPQWRPRLPEVAAKFPKWKRLVAEWDELEKMYEAALANGTGREMYDRMKKIGL